MTVLSNADFRTYLAAASRIAQHLGLPQAEIPAQGRAGIGIEA